MFTSFIIRCKIYLGTLFATALLVQCGPVQTITQLPEKNRKMDVKDKKMKVEIWSDVMCPFCYIGKRKFEQALEQFPEKHLVEVIWKSYQLSPNLKTDPGKNIHQFLAEHKGMEVAEARRLNEQVTNMAAKVGLVYHFDKAIVANSHNAHRFSHFAKKTWKAK